MSNADKNPLRLKQVLDGTRKPTSADKKELRAQLLTANSAYKVEPITVKPCDWRP